MNLGSRTPPPDVVRTTFEVGGSPSDLAVADVTADGRLDVAVASGDNIIVVQGDGAGGFRKMGAFPAGENATGILVVDWNGEGHPDVAAADHETDCGLTGLVVDGLDPPHAGEA